MTASGGSSSPSSSTPVSPQVQAERQRLVIQYRIISIIKKWIEWRYEKISKKKSWCALLDEFCIWLDKSGNEKMKTWGAAMIKAMVRTCCLFT